MSRGQKAALLRAVGTEHADAAPDNTETEETTRVPQQRPPSRTRRGRRRLAGLVGLALVAATALASWRYVLPHTVVLTPVTRGELILSARGSGTLDALTKASISAGVAGRLDSLDAEAGQTIAAGAVLATLDSRELASQAEAAKAAQKAAELAARQADADAQRADAALANAQASFDRQSALFAAGTVSRSVLDAAQSALSEAKSASASARAAAERADALWAQAKASRKGAEAQLAKTSITAPFAGLIVATDRNAGDFVSAGQEIATLVDPQSVVLTARLDESVIAQLRLGASATIRFENGAGAPISGTVVRIGREVDDQTREFTVDIQPGHLPQNWAIGQRGVADIRTGVRADVLTVPADMIVRRGAATGVWIEKKGRSLWAPVLLGPIGGNRVEIDKGLRAGDLLVPPAGAYQGMPVRAEGMPDA